jgi:HEAT repeat protein
MLSDPSDQVRLIAAQALSTSRDPRAVTALVIALTKDEEPAVRREAALALGQLLDEKTADDLRKLGLHALATAAENDPDLDVCGAARTALHALARLGAKL